MPELPEQSNFYATIDTSFRPLNIAGLFRPPLWEIRKCSWTDYEATSEFADVVIESSNPVLVHGAVAGIAVNATRIIEPLIAAGLSGSFECYDEENVLLYAESYGRSGGA